jgi:hypothetical protein
VSDQAKGDPFGEKWGNKVYKTSTHGSWTKESSAKRDEEIAKTVPTRRSAAVPTRRSAGGVVGRVAG